MNLCTLKPTARLRSIILLIAALWITGPGLVAQEPPVISKTDNTNAETGDDDTTQNTTSETTEASSAPVDVNAKMEHESSQQIAAGLNAGVAVWLQEGETEFLGVFTEHTADRQKGTALILHDTGATADHPVLVAPLQQSLPEAGWSTLSLQLPISDDPDLAVLESISRRIQSGLEFLQEKKQPNVVLIGHGTGAAAGLHFLSGKKRPIFGFVAIGITSLDIAVLGAGKPVQGKQTKPKTNLKAEIHTAFRRMSLPVLDIYGGSDFDNTKGYAEQRLAGMHKTRNKTSRQMKIAGADHNFSGMTGVLTKTIRGWMEQLTTVKRTP